MLIFAGFGPNLIGLIFLAYLIFHSMLVIGIHKRNKQNLPTLIVDKKGIDILNQGYFEWKDIDKIFVEPMSKKGFCLRFDLKERMMPARVRDEYNFGFKMRHKSEKQIFLQVSTPKDLQSCIRIISKFHSVQKVR